MTTLLLRPLAFITIKHPDSTPSWIIWRIPFLSAILLLGTTKYFSFNVDVFSGSGLISHLLGFFQNLPGFYIAALAAIATFQNEDMLKLMPGVPPTMKVLVHGGLEVVRLTRRRFLSSMFGYLTVLSIALTLMSVGALSYAEPIKIWICSDSIRDAVKYFFLFVYATLSMQMVSITFWGIFYLGERVHTPD